MDMKKGVRIVSSALAYLQVLATYSTNESNSPTPVRVYYPFKGIYNHR